MIILGKKAWDKLSEDECRILTDAKETTPYQRELNRWWGVQMIGSVRDITELQDQGRVGAHA